MAEENIARPIVIGLTGPIGSGVSTVAEALAARDFGRAKLSSAIVSEVEKQQGKSGKEIEDLRVLLQDHGNKLRSEKGVSHWVELALGSVDIGKNVVVEGIRNVGEVEYLRERFRWFFLLAIDAPKSTRWKRVKESLIYKGNEAKFDRDDARDTQEDDPMGQQVERCVSDADYVLLNHEDLDYSATRQQIIQERLQEDIALMNGSKSRPPSSEEVGMATAYAQSHASMCLKRHVGAVIVNPKGIPLSLGFNENPVPMKPCLQQYHNTCFKDQDMHAKLESMVANQPVICPKCGTPNKEMKKPWECINSNCRENLKNLFFPSRNMELCTAIHAEERAIRSLANGRADDSTMYVTTCPCFQCARYIVDAGIKRVVYVEAYPVKESIRFLSDNGIKVSPFQGFKSRAFSLLFQGVR